MDGCFRFQVDILWKLENHPLLSIESTWDKVSSRSPRNAADVVHVALAHLGLSEGSQAAVAGEVWPGFEGGLVFFLLEVGGDRDFWGFF